MTYRFWFFGKQPIVQDTVLHFEIHLVFLKTLSVFVVFLSVIYILRSSADQTLRVWLLSARSGARSFAIETLLSKDLYDTSYSIFCAFSSFSYSATNILSKSRARGAVKPIMRHSWTYWISEGTAKHLTPKNCFYVLKHEMATFVFRRHVQRFQEISSPTIAFCTLATSMLDRKSQQKCVHRTKTVRHLSNSRPCSMLKYDRKIISKPFQLYDVSVSLPKRNPKDQIVKHT